MSLKIVDLNNETVEEQPAIEAEPNEEQQQPEIINEVIEEINEENHKDVKEEEPTPTPKPKPKPKPNDLVFCPDCSRQMTYKNLRYSHKCYPEPPPVKKQANPKSKAKPKPKPKPPPEVYYSDSEEEEVVAKPFIKKKQPVSVSQPITPASALAQQYQLLQQQMMQQKQERYNKICQGMFAPRTKKR